MTSAWAPKTSSNHVVRPRVPHGHGPAQPRCAGFTLVELLLVVLLMALLTALGMASLTGWRPGEPFQEAVLRFETSLRLAQADSAAHSRRLRLEMDFASGQMSLLEESDPLHAPGQWAPLQSSWAGRFPADRLHAVAAEYLGESILRDAWRAGEWSDRPPPAQSVTFGWGTSESVLIELADAGDYDLRALVRIDGLHGTILSRFTTADLVDEARDEMRNP